MTTQNTPDNINVELDKVLLKLRTTHEVEHNDNQWTTEFVYTLDEAKQAIQQELLKARKVTGETSDGYHTFSELYHYRMLYNALYVNELIRSNPYAVHKSKRHSDGELAFGGGWFVVTMDLPTGQVTNHYELKDWNNFHCAELDRAPEWDGHTPQEAAKRLQAKLKGDSDE